VAKSTASVIRNGRTGDVLASKADEAAGPIQSLLGLMFKRSIPDGYGLVFRPARGIHTNFMRFPIDLVFFDRQNLVVKVRPAMVPWRWDFTRAAGVIEMNPGSASRANLQPGDPLLFETV
jgi:uncharacterized protein